ncbi:hypothetical protein TNCV_2133401 [Trichonephila clavipes]|nr:hypothetical protein TNCV_2133401 [Trichonephila clavipes]
MTHNKRNMLFLPQPDKNCKMPTLLESALLVKQYYRSSENAVAAVRESHRLKKQQRGPMTKRAPKDMMVKFKKTGQIGALPGRGRKKRQDHHRKGYCYSGRGSKQ